MYGTRGHAGGAWCRLAPWNELDRCKPSVIIKKSCLLTHASDTDRGGTKFSILYKDKKVHQFETRGQQSCPTNKPTTPRSKHYSDSPYEFNYRVNGLKQHCHALCDFHPPHSNIRIIIAHEGRFGSGVNGLYRSYYAYARDIF